MYARTPWQPLVLLALALFGALVLRLVFPLAGAAVAAFGATGIVLHYRNKRAPTLRQNVPAVDAGPGAWRNRIQQQGPWQRMAGRRFP